MSSSTKDGGMNKNSSNAGGGGGVQMVNPHNPEFITKRPWYLGDHGDAGGGDGGGGGSAAATTISTTTPSAVSDPATLEHHQKQLNASVDRMDLSLSVSEAMLNERREQQRMIMKTKQFYKGQWVEALKKNRFPYRLCQIIDIHKVKDKDSIRSSSRRRRRRRRQQEFDLKYEDGTIERKVRLSNDSEDDDDDEDDEETNGRRRRGRKSSNSKHPRIRMTKSGNRYCSSSLSGASAAEGGGEQKESFDGKRDQYHGYDRDNHNAKIAAKFERRDKLRRQIRERQQQEQQQNDDEKQGDNDDKRKKSKDKATAPSDSDFNDSDDDSDRDGSDDSDDEFVQRDEDDRVITTRLARQGGVGGAQMKVTARNLRIREDTAKYLRNLDVDSAYYDPKSRSMRDNPTPHIPDDRNDFVGDNFARITGDAVKFAQSQVFAWDTTKKVNGTSTSSNNADGSGQSKDSTINNDTGNDTIDIHPQANPSQVELLQKQFQSKKTNLKHQKKKIILDKYGGTEYLDGTSGLATVKDEQSKNHPSGNGGVASTRDKLRFGASTTKEEYGRDGRLLHTNDGASGSGRNVRRQPLLSKYEEDIFMNGHTTVWGSYFHRGAFIWGYSDDHSLMKMSYCTGDAGRIANDESNALKYGTGKAGSAELAQAREMLKVMKNNKSNDNKNEEGRSSSARLRSSAPSERSKMYGDVDPTTMSDVGLDRDKLKVAMEKIIEQKNKKKNHDGSNNNETADDRKRKYHSMNADDVDIEQEDMEAYRLLKERKDDPMANIDHEQDLLLDYTSSTKQKKRI